MAQRFPLFNRGAVTGFFKPCACVIEHRRHFIDPLRGAPLKGVKGIVQRINHNVFKQPVELMENVDRVTRHALATLKGAADPGAYAPRFAEVRGDALLAKNDRDGALKAYQ